MNASMVIQKGEELRRDIFQLETALENLNSEIKNSKDPWMEYLYISNSAIIEEILAKKRKQLRGCDG